MQIFPDDDELDPVEILSTESTTDFWLKNSKFDMEGHLTLKIDYVVQQLMNRLRSSEYTLIQRICDVERTQLLIILAIAVQNSELAGYLLTHNRSNFIVTDGSIAYMYSCPEQRSPLQSVSRCYNRIPVYYKNSIMYVDPVTRQTFVDADETPCDGHIDNTFHMDLNDRKSWYNLIPYIDSGDIPEYFSPTNIIRPLSPFSLETAAKAGMHTPKAVAKFWSKVTSNVNENAQLKKIMTIMGRSFQTVGLQNQIDKFHGGFGRYSGPVYMDSIMTNVR